MHLQIKFSETWFTVVRTLQPKQEHNHSNPTTEDTSYFNGRKATTVIARLYQSIYKSPNIMNWRESPTKWERLPSCCCWPSSSLIEGAPAFGLGLRTHIQMPSDPSQSHVTLIIIVISKSLNGCLKDKRRAEAYSRSLGRVRGVVERYIV